MCPASVVYSADDLVGILKVAKDVVLQFLERKRLLGEKSGDTWRVSQEEANRFMGVSIGSTVGEKHFAYYLNQNGIPFEFEKEWPGKQRRPDFSIPHEGRHYLFEVKDLEGPVPRLGASAFDPVKPIRDHINEAQKQFQEFPNDSCSIVLFNRGVMTFLDDPSMMFGAMHGPIDLRFRYDVARGCMTDDPPEQVFSGRKAKMRAYAGESEPKNTRISALIGIRVINIGQKRMSKYLQQFPGDSWFDHLQDDVQDFDPNEVRIGLTIWENRDAKIKLPDGLFRGPFDVRWSGPDDAGIERVYIGSGLEEFERIERDLKASPGAS